MPMSQSKSQSKSQSMTQHVTALETEVEIVAGGFLGNVPALALASGEIALFDDTHMRKVTAHEGSVILMGQSDGTHLVTGGDDGRVVATAADGSMHEIAKQKGWIDALVLRGDGPMAWASGA